MELRKTLPNLKFARGCMFQGIFLEEEQQEASQEVEEQEMCSQGSEVCVLSDDI